MILIVSTHALENNKDLLLKYYIDSIDYAERADANVGESCSLTLIILFTLWEELNRRATASSAFPSKYARSLADPVMSRETCAIASRDTYSR